VVTAYTGWMRQVRSLQTNEPNNARRDTRLLVARITEASNKTITEPALGEMSLACLVDLLWRMAGNAASLGNYMITTKALRTLLSED
jgi:hypothetical protein